MIRMNYGTTGSGLAGYGGPKHPFAVHSRFAGRSKQGLTKIVGLD